MNKAFLSIAASTLIAATATSQLVVMPPHSSAYNGFSRGYSFTSPGQFFISTMDLPLDAQQAGDTASYYLNVNGVEVFHSAGTAGSVSPAILIAPGDLVTVVGNWSPALTGNFSAHNSYASGAGGVYSTPINGVATTLYRAGVQWDIGDPGYSAAAVFNTLTGSIGRIDVTTNPPTGLFAIFSSDVTEGQSPLTVNFTDASFSSDPGGVVAWTWDFENDGTIDSTLQNPTHIYAACGTYDVSLTVFDAVHTPATELKTAMITTDTVAASFSDSVIAPLTVQFTDTSTGGPTAWSWDLDGDGTVDSTVQNPAFVYTSSAGVAVTLDASRLCGPVSSSTKTVTPLPNIATLYAGGNGGAAGWTMHFDMDVTNANGITIESFASNISTGAGAVGSVEFWVCSGTWVGNETNPDAWSLRGTGTTAGANAAGTPTAFAMASNFYLPAGSYGVALHYLGLAMPYTNGNGTNQTFTNADITLNLGASRNTVAGSPFVASTSTFNPRVWNGTIFYNTFSLSGEAAYGFFGAGCPGSLGVATLTNDVAPSLGATMTVTIDGLPLGVAIMMTGFSNTTSILGPLPVDTGAFGAPGCLLRVSPDANAFAAGVAPNATWTLGVPNDPSLSGLLMYQQAVVVDPGVNAAGAVASDAAAMIIGL